MGLISTIFGNGAKNIGEAVAIGAGAFIPNAENSAEREFKTGAMASDEYRSVMEQYGAEFIDRGLKRTKWDSFVDGLNRLPRPVMTFGVIGLFVYAMISPVSFSERMKALGLIPDPLWWILGAIVSFYFAARSFEKNKLVNARQAVFNTAMQAPAMLEAIGIVETSPDRQETPQTGETVVKRGEVAKTGNEAIDDFFSSKK